MLDSNSNKKQHHSVGHIQYSCRRDWACSLLVLASGVKPQGDLGSSPDLASHVTAHPSSLEFILKNKAALQQLLESQAYNSFILYWRIYVRLPSIWLIEEKVRESQSTRGI